MTRGDLKLSMRQEKCLCGLWIVSAPHAVAIRDAMHWHQLHPTHKAFRERTYQ